MRVYQQLKNISENKKDYFFFFFLMFSGLLLFAPSLQIPFISDEVAFIKRNTVSNFSQLLALFDKKDYDGFYYRPLGNFVSGVLTFFAEENPLFYRLFNVILHIINAFILFKFAKSISQKINNDILPCAAAFLFLVYPGNDYALLWHTALFDRLLLGFYLLGLVSYLQNYRVTVPSICFFILAMFSKESAFSFPLVIFIADFFLNKKETSIKSAAKKSGIYFLILIGFLLLRFLLFNNNIFTAQDAHSSAGLFTIIKNYFFFGGFLLFPFSPREMQQLLMSHRVIFFFFGGLGVLGLSFVLYKKKSDKLFWFLLLFIILTILPASRLFMRWYLYLPSTGFALLISWIILTSFNKRKIVGYIFLFLLFSIYSFSLVQKEITWLDVSKKAVISFNELRKECSSNEYSAIIFLTIPAKVGDVPVYQLQFEKLAGYYLKKEMNISVLSKSFFTNWDEAVGINSEKSGDIILTHNKDNYFLLFDNKKNLNFDLKTGKQLSFSVKPEKGILYVFFSKGKFQKING